jgi:hypothetical protein
LLAQRSGAAFDQRGALKRKTRPKRPGFEIKA